MNMTRTLGNIAAAALLLAVCLGGCGTSPNARFYTLTSLSPPEKPGEAKTGSKDVVVGLGPVSIPDYLDRPQIAVRSSRNELILGEFDRWAGSLRSDVARVLMENLSTLLATDAWSVVSWRQGIPSDYRVAVDVSRFDIRHGTDVLLKAQWVVFSKDGKGMLLMRESEIVEPLTGTGYESAVACMGRALEVLGREIALGVKSVQADSAGNKEG
ncbi:membrane integrity-associated transporter subunit PqiC [bacterium]|nr:membrane integrity-associated transporter subunit PqiC [bacterium]